MSPRPDRVTGRSWRFRTDRGATAAAQSFPWHRLGQSSRVPNSQLLAADGVACLRPDTVFSFAAQVNMHHARDPAGERPFSSSCVDCY